MPGRSPHRHSPPPPPLISRHSPSRRRVRSPDRLHSEMSDRGRDRREVRPSRRSRSPPQVRPFSPPLKRKVSPSREKEIPRRTKISQSPVRLRGSSEQRTYVPPEPETRHVVRTVSDTSSRFVDKEFEEEERAIPKFRGPEGKLDFNIHELKQIRIGLFRNARSTNDEGLISRQIVNPDSVVPVRRPDYFHEDYDLYNRRGKGMRGSGNYQEQRRGMNSKHFSPPPHWVPEDGYLNNQRGLHDLSKVEKKRSKSVDQVLSSQHLNPCLQLEGDTDEGSKPLFTRSDVASVSSKDRSLPPEEFRRVVNISTARGSNERERSRERVKYSSSVPYEDNNHRPQQYYREREPSPYNSGKRSPPREEYFENRSRLQERAGSSRDEFREGEVRRIVERKPSFDRQSYERESDLRARINEKREPPVRNDERELLSKRFEMERERPRLSHEVERESLGRSNLVGPGRGHEMERKRPIRSHEMERERPVRSHEMERERPRPSHEMERERPRPSHEMERERPRPSHELERERSGRSNETQRSKPGRPRDFDKEHPVRGHEMERDRPSRSAIEMSRERLRRSHERERPSRSHHSPPSSSRERRRPGSMEPSRERGRREDWEREGGGERRRRHSRERSDRPRDRSDHYEEKRRKPDDEKKVYKSYEEKEFTLSIRGRGGMSMRRGMPPGLRGRGMVRGMPRFPRGGMMVPRGMPRLPPFMPRFPPRFFPPY